MKLIRRTINNWTVLLPAKLLLGPLPNSEGAFLDLPANNGLAGL